MSHQPKISAVDSLPVQCGVVQSEPAVDDDTLSLSDEALDVEPLDIGLYDVSNDDTTLLTGDKVRLIRSLYCCNIVIHFIQTLI